MSDKPGRQELTGYVLRDYDDLMTRLYRSRDAQRLTLADVADRIGCHLQAVSVHLRGTQEARGRRVFELADALGYDLALIPREGAANRRLTAQELATDDEPRLRGLSRRVRADGRFACSQPGHNTLGCTCPETEPGTCNCGHEGLDPMFHLRPCPIAERRAAERQGRNA